MLDWLFGKTNKAQNISKRTQLYFRDDYKFCFRKLPVFAGALVRKSGDNYIEGWEHYYNNQFMFDGYKDIPGDMVTINSERDIIFDPYNIIDAEKKPKLHGELNQKHIKQIATTAIYENQKQKKKGLLMDKVTAGLLIVLVLMGMAFFIRMVAG